MTWKRPRSPWIQGPWTRWDHAPWEREFQMGTEASKSGQFYRAAHDTNIAIHGKTEVRGYTQEGSQLGIGIHIADVKRPRHQ